MNTELRLLHITCGENDMCDTKKYEQIYKDIKELNAEDTIQLINETEDESERQFFMIVGNYLLQEKQRQVIARNLF